MPSRTNLLWAFAVGAALVAISSKVDAADLLGSLFSDASPTSTQPVALGTGWYLRGDAAFADDSIPPLAPGLTQFLSLDRQPTFNLDLGAGYKLNNWLRFDGVVDYWKPNWADGIGAGKTCVTQLTTIDNFPVVTATDTCTPHAIANIQRWDLLGNAYVDIGNWYGITPYVGAGAGLSITVIKDDVNWYMSNGLPYMITTDGFYYNWDTSTTTTRFQFAWALMGGLSYAITPQILLDLGYRYIYLGKLPGIPGPSGTIISQPVDAHEVRLGIRYMID